MTIAAFLAEYTSSVAGAFKNQILKIIKPLSMRTFAADIVAMLQAQTGNAVTRTADAAVVLTTPGRYVLTHANPTVTWPADISNYEGQIYDVKMEGTGKITHNWNSNAIAPGFNADGFQYKNTRYMFYFDGTKIQY